MKALPIVVFTGLALGLVILDAQGQPVTQQDITGNECWSAGQGPGGPSNWLCINQVRNGTALRIVSGTGTSITQTQADSTVFWTGTAPSTLSINLTASPFDGEIFSFATDTTLTTLVTLVAGSGTTLNASFSAQTVSPAAGVEWQYNKATTKWFRVR
jgi:hypothetical protein